MTEVCNKDCWNCELEGCPYTLRVSLEMDQEAKDNIPNSSRELSIKRYNTSRKRKETQKRYWQSEKGKEANNRNTKAYYHRHKEEILAKKREQYKLNPEYFRQKRRAQYLKPSGVEIMLRKVSYAAGIDRVNPHMLRHSFASHMVEHDVSTEMIQAMLGHRSPASTNLYMHVSNKS